jgi:hypothetical protein
MPRIITQESNKRLRREYRLRFLTALFAVVGTVGVVTAALMLPSYVLLSSYRDAYARPVQEGSREIERLNEEYTDRLSETHELSSRVTYGDSAYSDVMDTLFLYADGLVVIDAIELGRSGDQITVSLRGSSASREGLLAFEERVLANTRFKGFSLPIETLAKQSDISFNVTFTYNEK